MTSAPPVEFRTRSGRALSVLVAAVCAVALVSALVDDPGTAVRFAPALVLPAVVVWALFGRPAVVVSDDGVELRNVLRTIRLPWGAVRRVDTKYALTIETPAGSYSAWAAPAPSRVQTMGSSPEDLRHLPESSYIGGAVRPGDLLSSASGQAAAYIRRRWQELADAGELEPARAADVQVRWHGVQAAVVVVLAALAVWGLA